MLGCCQIVAGVIQGFCGKNSVLCIAITPARFTTISKHLRDFSSFFGDLVLAKLPAEKRKVKPQTITFVNVFIESTQVDLWPFVPSTSAVVCDIPGWVQCREHAKIRKLQAGYVPSALQPRAAAICASRPADSHGAAPVVCAEHSPGCWGRRVAWPRAGEGMQQCHRQAGKAARAGEHRDRQLPWFFSQAGHSDHTHQLAFPQKCLK